MLHSIRLRYFEDSIYTGIGAPILISINPYKKIPGIYSEKTMESYRTSSQAKSAGSVWSYTICIFSSIEA